MNLSAINQFFNQSFNTTITEEMVLLILGGSSITILLGIFLIILFAKKAGKASQMKGDLPADNKNKTTSLSKKATKKKLERLEKEHLKRQKEEEKTREAIQINKEKERLLKIEEEEKQIQQKLAEKEEEQKKSQFLRKELSTQVENKLTPEPKSFVERLKSGMEKTRNNLVEGVSNLVLGKKEIDEDLLDEFEELLITADIGPETTIRIINSITEKVERTGIKNPQVLKDLLQEEIVSIMDKKYSVPTTNDKKPLILLFVGVNGVGKTTTIGKIASQYCKEGKKVLMAAGDTFRAAAIEQLSEWSKRAGCDIVSKNTGSDPSAVMYETVQKAVDENYDVVICDTAGRLHTKKNLMEELKKMVRVIKKIIPDAPHETLLVLDATTGQNAIFQVREFKDTADLSGLIITKLDGTAKGGVVIGIVNEFDIPVRYIGIGEGVEDLRPFDSRDFTQSLFA